MEENTKNIEAQFSIYKIDCGKFKDIQGLEKKNKNFPANILKFILMEIKKQISKKEGIQWWDVNKENIRGIVYKTIHHPLWEKMAREMIGDSPELKDDVILENVNVSYVFFYIENKKLYAMTAGFGNHLIKDYIEKNWGLYLIPKMLNEDEGVIREVKENNLYGNTITMSKANSVFAKFI